MRRMERVPGDDVGGYRVIRTLGRGGSGAVYLVHDEGGGEAALKLIDATDAGARARLAREVAALQALRHPAVPRVLDAELDDAEPFVVFEFIDGPSLSAHVKRNGPLPPARVAELANALASALAAVHAAGVVHRDVTPANVLLGAHGPVLIDFGLSHHQTDDRLTVTGLVSGTAGYVAPEVIDGADPTTASDDWAFAATLAFAAVGHAPFGTGMGALSRTLSGDLEPDVPLALARALTAAPQFRPSPLAVARALGEADGTMVLDARAVDATLVAPTWLEDSDGDFEVAEEAEWDGDEWDGDDELPERVVPRRRTVLLLWGVALVALATVAPLIAAAIALGAVIVARAVESAARAVWRSRERRGVEQGGLVAQAFASPWHLGRALVLSLPAVLIAGGVAYLISFVGHTMMATTRAPLLDTIVGVVAIALLGWGPRGREVRRGAHLVAAGLAPTRGWNVGWGIAAAVVAIVCFGVSFGGTDQVWWPLGSNGLY